MGQPDDWLRQLELLLTTTAQTTEAWVMAAVDSTLDAADNVAEEIDQHLGPVVEEWAAQLHHTLEPVETALDQEAERLSQAVADQLTPLVEPVVASLDAWLVTLATPVNNTVEPWLNDHPPCIGCRHYYGQVHGGNLLVCAMYPYGPEVPRCPDWESVWPHPSDFRDSKE